MDPPDRLLTVQNRAGYVDVAVVTICTGRCHRQSPSGDALTLSVKLQEPFQNRCHMLVAR